MPNAISLGVGEPDFVTPRHIREAVFRSLEVGMTSYTSNQGMPELLEEIAQYLKKRFSLQYDGNSEILVTIGASEAIDLAFRAILEPGDEVLVPEPSYVSYAPCIQLAGGKPVGVPTFAANSFKLQAEDIKKKITPRTKALILCYPNNPTGAIMTHEDYRDIVKLVQQYELIVISDEIYAELTYRGNHQSIAAMDGMKEHTILISGLSKSFAMTGWRLGFAAAPKPLLKGMLKIHQYTALCAPISSQVAAIEALRNGLAECQAMVSQYDQRRRYITCAFQHMGLSCPEPLGAFYVFPSIQTTGLDSYTFAEKLLREEQVAVVPGDVFGPSGREHIRCSYATSIEKIREAVERIKRFLSRHQKEMPRLTVG
jgi:aminotransferase